MDQVPGITRIDVQSLTFIPGKLEENVIFERADPTYRGKLMAMSRVERARLLGGNWKARPSSGDFFNKAEVSMLDAVPDDVVSWIRRWDLAASEPSETRPDPDWTAGVKMGKRRGGRFVVADVYMFQKRADEVRKAILRTAQNDGQQVKVGIPQDPGQAGKEQIQSYTTMLAGFTVVPDRETGDKQTRAEPFAAQWQGGNVDVVRGPWNALYFSQMEAFPAKDVHDDAVDASSGAFGKLTRARTMFEVV